MERSLISKHCKWGLDYLNYVNKIFIGIAMSLFAVATVFNMNMLNEKGAGDVSLDAIAVMAQANTEYPHYGNYGRDTFDCSKEFSVSGKGTVCYKGFCVDYDGDATVVVKCENCAWDCNKDGANNTCDP